MIFRLFDTMSAPRRPRRYTGRHRALFAQVTAGKARSQSR